MSKLRSVLGPVAAAVLLITTGCGTGGAASVDGGTTGVGDIDPDGTFRYVFVQNPSTLDPHRSANTWDMVYFRLAFDQLIWQNDDGDLEPMLATEWEFVDDATALELTLRDDVDFIDGQHFDAEAVVANLDRAMTLEESAHKGQLARVESVEAIEDYRVRITLNGPGGNLPALLASTAGSMMSPASFENPDLDQNPVGTGMAKLIENIPGQVTRWERNENYWDPDAALAQYYEIYVQTASPTRANMLQTGQAELTYLLPQDQQAAEAAGLTVVPSLSSTIFTVSINVDNLDDPRLRYALEHAIDRSAIVDGVFFGAGEPVAQLLPPDHWAFDPNVTPENPAYGYDPERAKSLLAEAGYPNGYDLEMLIPSLDDHRAIGEAMMPMLEEAGFNVTTRVIEAPTTAVTFFAQKEGDIVIGAGAPMVIDPTNSYQIYLPDQFANPWGNSSEEFIDAWNSSLDGTTRDERLPGIHPMIEEAKNLANNIPLFVFIPPSAWTGNVMFPDGYTPNYAPHFRGVGVTGG